MYLIIGIVTTGVIVMIFICIAIILVVICLKVAWKKREVDNSVQLQQNSSESCSLSFISMDSTSRVNLLAFRKQETPHTFGNTSDSLHVDVSEKGDLYHKNLWAEDMADTYIEIHKGGTMALCDTSDSSSNLSNLGHNCITLKEKSRYSALTGASGAKVHQYDEVPFSVSCVPPCEYEVPTTAAYIPQRLPLMPHTDDDELKDEMNIYEEI